MANKGNSGAVVLGVVIALVAFAFYKNPGWLDGGGADSNTPPFTGSEGGKGRYVALGDSYTSAPYVGHSGGGPEDCRRSASNYPNRVARAIKVGTFVDVSCSGARTSDMAGTQRLESGSNPPQLNSLNSATTLVTVGIGGNNIGFVSLVRGCVSATPSGSRCRDANTSGGTDRVAAKIAATAPKVGAVLDEIHQRAPSARVLVVGYPTILPTTGDGCWPVLPYGGPDVGYLRGEERRLNAMLAAQARAHGAGFVDTAAASVGHDVCTGLQTRWVEGLVPTSAAAPMHPNAKGEHAAARAVLAAL
ncbi:MAG: SGNH/GDSL hydrolase family protein [Sciscionella sp.]